MNVKINYKNIPSKKNSINHVLFTDENFNILGLKKHILDKEYSLISDLLKSKDLKNKIISLDINSKKKITLISLKKNISCSEIENLGAKFFDTFKDSKNLNDSITCFFCSFSVSLLITGCVAV